MRLYKEKKAEIIFVTAGVLNLTALIIKERADLFLTAAIFITGLLVTYVLYSEIKIINGKVKDVDTDCSGSKLDVKVEQASGGDNTGKIEYGDEFAGENDYDMFSAKSNMHSLLGLLSICIDAEKNTAQRGYLNMAIQAADRLRKYIANVERDEGGLTKIMGRQTYSQVNLESMFVMLQFELNNENRSSPKEIQWEISEEIPSSIALNFESVKRVLKDMCRSSLSAIESGVVTIRCTLQYGSLGQEFIVFQVADSGVGIPPIGAELYYQVDDAEKNQVIHGNSLSQGVSGEVKIVVSKISKGLDGEVWHMSRSGVGSNAYYRTRVSQKESRKLKIAELDVAHIDESDAKEASAGVGWGDVVLIVEDNPVNRLVTREMLKKMGLCVLEAENGQEALDILSEESVKLVLMDLNMPVMDGIEACTRIRTDKRLDSIPIVVMTGLSSEHSLENIGDMGISECLQKPVTADAMGAVLKKYLG